MSLPRFCAIGDGDWVSLDAVVRVTFTAAPPTLTLTLASGLTVTVPPDRIPALREALGVADPIDRRHLPPFVPPPPLRRLP